jgi:hypothetical protein
LSPGLDTPSAETKLINSINFDGERSRKIPQRIALT